MKARPFEAWDWTEESHYPVALRAMEAMRLAAQGTTPTTEPEISEGPEHRTARSSARRPRRHWPSGIPELDAATQGGFYGLTTIVAPPKLGKSGLALSSAIEAAATQNWTVLYLNAELDDEELMDRVDRYMQFTPHTDDANGYLGFMCPGVPFHREQILERLEGDAHPELPILVVLDSVNSLAEKIDGAYLEALRFLTWWATESRRVSRGAASFLAISEINTRGHEKGAQLSYWSDLVIRMDRDDLDTAQIKLSIQHARSTPGGIDVGLFERMSLSGRLRCVMAADGETDMDARHV